MDLISREAAIDALREQVFHELSDDNFIGKVSGLVGVIAVGRRGDMMDDLISRQAAIDAARDWYEGLICGSFKGLEKRLRALPSAQLEIIRCKDCIYYDPPHVENNGVRYEYDEMPADAFDALGTGLVNAEYGINIGGRCCVDYYCKNYSDDKRVFVREDNYCGRAERRTE